MNSLTVPAEEDWGNYSNDLDQEYAHRIFAGKSAEQVMPEFERNVIERASELRFMPEVPFRYYMLAFKDYVLSDLVVLNSLAPDAASCFLGLIIEKLRVSPEVIAPIMDELMPVVLHVAANQEKFGADLDIYGDFREMLVEIQSLRGIG
jgi:hypothetical protein